METSSDQSLDALMQRLSVLEELLESPIVPGESYEWADKVRDQLSGLSTAFELCRHEGHRHQFAQIEEADAAMPARVEKLRQEDEAISAEISRLTNSFATATTEVAKVQGLPQNDEGQVANRFPPLVADALALVIRIRMQENALRTWYMEAFQRDRGVAD